MTATREPLPGVWTIAREVLAALDAHGREGRPAECCGVLIGRCGHISASRRAANLSNDPHRFELDPQAHVRAIRDTRGSDLSVVGFYHSHPHSAPFPSASDLAESTYPDAVHLIVGFPDGGDRAVIRAFSVRQDGFVELALVPVGEGDRSVPEVPHTGSDLQVGGG